MPELHRTQPLPDAPASLKPTPAPSNKRGGAVRSSVIQCGYSALLSTVWAAGLAAILAAVACVAAVIAFRTIDPPGSMLIWSQWQAGQSVDQRWISIERNSPALVRAVIMSEDNQFCSHWGIDLGELKATLRRAERLGQEPSRGASTISMQLTKNLLLWPGKSYVRKAFELPLTLLVEALWSKRRIMEVYLNIAEWGPGVFGAEAAAQHHFHKSVSRLSDAEATLLAVSLPNPFTRVASKPTPNLRRVADVIERRVKGMGKRGDCVLAPGTSGRRLP